MRIVPLPDNPEDKTPREGQSMDLEETQTFDFERYRYTPLPSKTSIRIVDILEKEDAIEEQVMGTTPLIQCRLRTVDLNDNPNYDALSYTWGNPLPETPESRDNYASSKKFPISLNGRVHFISRNLHEALSQFRPSWQKPDPDIDKRFQPFDKTNLIRAAEEGRVGDVMTFIHRGADVKCQDTFGETALHYAAENGHFEVVKLLVWAGSPIDTLDMHKRTPLDCSEGARQRQHKEVAAFLRDPQSITEKPGSNPLKHFPSRPFWIDAICIDQDNVQERNSQVAMMARIFSVAQWVVVWLGPKDEYTDTAYEAMSIMGKAEDDFIHYNMNWSNLARRYKAWKRGHLVDEDKTSDDCILSVRHFEALMALLHRSWFQRVWVIQEVASARNLSIYCGSTIFLWWDLFLLVQHDLTEHVTVLSHPQAPSVKYSNVAHGTEAWVLTSLRYQTKMDHADVEKLMHLHTYPLEELEQGETSKLSLPVLLCYTWNFRASDPRDKIFALVSICRVDGGTRDIIADYTRSTADLYTQMGKIFVLADGDNSVKDWFTTEIENFEPLEGLSFIQRAIDQPTNRQSYALPSWVPDFSRDLVTRRIWSPRFNASNRPPSIYSSPDTILRLDAHLFDEIELLENKPPEGLNPQDITYSTLSWLEFATHLNPTYPTGQSRIQALWRTLMVDDTWTHEETWYTTAKESFKEFLSEDFAWLLKISHLDHRRIQLLETLSATDGSRSLPSLAEITNRVERRESWVRIARPDAVDENEKEFHAAFFRNYRARCLFKTRKGFVGLGPRDMRVGDMVWILAGGRTPYVLRPSGKGVGEGRLRLVGEAYVHGVMNGEVDKGENVRFRPVEIE